LKLILMRKIFEKKNTPRYMYLKAGRLVNFVSYTGIIKVVLVNVKSEWCIIRKPHHML